MKLKSLIATLTFIVAAGTMTACSDGMKANRVNDTAPEENIVIPSENENETQQPSSQEILTRREVNAHAALTAMKNGNIYGDEQCSEDDVDSSRLETFYYPSNGGIREVNPAQVIESSESNINDLKMAVNAYAQTVEAANNPYCVVRAAGTIAEQLLNQYSSNIHDGVINASEIKIERMEVVVTAFDKSFEDAVAVIALREEIRSNNDRLRSSMQSLDENMPILEGQIQELTTLLSPCSAAECSERAQVAQAFVTRARNRFNQVSSYLSALNSPNPSNATEDSSHQAHVAEIMQQDIESLTAQASERIRSIQALGLGVVAVDPNQTGAQ